MRHPICPSPPEAVVPQSRGAASPLFTVAGTRSHPPYPRNQTVRPANQPRMPHAATLGIPPDNIRRSPAATQISQHRTAQPSAVIQRRHDHRRRRIRGRAEALRLTHSVYSGTIPGRLVGTLGSKDFRRGDAIRRAALPSRRPDGGTKWPRNEKNRRNAW